MGENESTATDDKTSFVRKVERNLKLAYFTLAGMSVAFFLCAFKNHVVCLRTYFFLFSQVQVDDSAARRKLAGCLVKLK